MKYFLLFFLTLLCTGCQLFQEQQQAGERVATEAKQEEVFVPVEKELYVITHTAMEYAKPNILAQAKKELNSFGALFEIERSRVRAFLQNKKRIRYVSSQRGYGKL